MRRADLEHVIRASAAITGDKSFVVIGSHAVLLPYPDVPSDLLLSNEVDLYPATHPELADLIGPAYPIERLRAWARARQSEATS